MKALSTKQTLPAVSSLSYKMWLVWLLGRGKEKEDASLDLYRAYIEIKSQSNCEQRTFNNCKPKARGLLAQDSMVLDTTPPWASVSASVQVGNESDDLLL